MQSILELFKLEVDYSSTSTQSTLATQSYWDYLSQKSIIHQLCLAKVQDYIGVTYTATQSILGTISARSQLFIHFVQQKYKIAQESLIQQLSQHWNYFSKSAKLHSSCLYSNSINTGTIHQLCFSKSASCIGVTYTATQSTLELFKLEVYYSSTLFQQSARLHRSHLYSNSINTGTI